MENIDVIKFLVGGFIGGFIASLFRKSDKNNDTVADITVRQAVSDEKRSALQDRVAITERDIKAIWRELDKVKKQ